MSQQRGTASVASASLPTSAPSASGAGSSELDRLNAAVFEVVNESTPSLPPHSRKLNTTKAEALKAKSDAALKKLNHAIWVNDATDEDEVYLDSRPRALPPFAARFDHICIAVSDVSHMSEFLTQTGGRACEGFLTPVYLSSTWEYSNTAELQVIAPVESFQLKKQLLHKGEQPTTTQAFWVGNTTIDPVSTANSSKKAPTNKIASGAAPNSTHSSPSLPLLTTPRPRSTFLQRYLRKHGPSVHHVAFLVPNLAQARKRFHSFGYSVYGYSDRDPLWKEFFLTPKQSLGVVIQIAESGSLEPNMSWQRSSAMLSQTHLTPVVKKHIARMNEGLEEWESAPDSKTNPDSKSSSAKKKRSSEKSGSSLTANATSAESSAPVASPSHSSSANPTMPSRLELLGLRMRCASEYKARRQWGSMFSASSITEFIDPNTRIKTLVFRWAQCPMYIAVDIVKPPPNWKGDVPAAPSRPASSAPANVAASNKQATSEAAQWDSPVWIELHSPASATPITHDAAANEMNLDLGSLATEQLNIPASPSSPSPAAQSTRNNAKPLKRVNKSASGDRNPGRGNDPSSSSSYAGPIAFSPTFETLPLNSSIMRSKFVKISQPIPLPPLPVTQVDPVFSLVSLPAKL